MNQYESNPDVLLTTSESAAFSELVEIIAQDFGGRISECAFIITVKYPAMGHEETFRLNWIETACKIIARSRNANCPVSYRVTYRADVQVEHIAATKNRRYVTLADYIRSTA